MTALPAATDFTGASVTEAQFKTAITSQRDFLASLLGSDGVLLTALQTLGVIGSNVVAKSANYTAISSDRGKLLSYTGSYTLSLNPAATLGNGFAFAVRNNGTGTITIDPSGSETINGQTTLLLSPQQALILVCSSSTWYTLGGDGTPAGQVAHFAMNSAPSGWLAADGSAQSRTTYAALFTAIGTSYGIGDGSTTFNLPDLRGYFLRGAGTNSDGTAAGAFGVNQADELKAHTHTMNVTANGQFGGSSNFVGNTTSGLNTGSTGGSETRPRNIPMLACIKY